MRERLQFPPNWIEIWCQSLPPFPSKMSVTDRQYTEFNIFSELSLPGNLDLPKYGAKRGEGV